ncbi:MAG: redoxin family protein [Planctomycetes bacterium]|nr:redoxin family protein [Planctomycetota bacterium]
MTSACKRFVIGGPVTLMAVAGLSVAAQAQSRLQIGDPAPPLLMTDWIKGDPIDMSKGVGKNVYVLEFWATWCGPCLPTFPMATALQDRYRDDGVVVVGVTSKGQFPQLQSKERVSSFVERQGRKMGYTVGFDENNTVNALYMQALGAMGIPYTVVVDKAGNIAWTGHPAAGLEQAVEEMISPDYDPKTAYRRGRADAIFQNTARFIQGGVWPQAMSGLEEALKVDPSHSDALNYYVNIRAVQLNDRNGLRTWVDAYLKNGATDVVGLTNLAEALMTVEVLDARDPELILRVAKAAYAVGKESNAIAIATYARAAFGIGMVDQAVRLQEQGLRVASESVRAEYQITLDYYKTCKGLQDEAF